MTSAKSLPVAIAQFTVAEEPERNLEILDGFARDAAAGGAKLLVLPEGLIARRGDDDSYAAAHAQPLDGPFVDGLRRISAQRHIVLMVPCMLRRSKEQNGMQIPEFPTRSL